MNILITGAAGYIASHVLKQLLESSGHKITIIDNFYSGSKQALKTLQNIGPFEVIELDLSDFAGVEGVFRAHQFDAVLHFAAFIEVGESVQNPAKYYLNNTANTANLAQLSAKYGVKSFIFSSTAAVYGEGGGLDKDGKGGTGGDFSRVGADKTNLNIALNNTNFAASEASPTAPINPYGHSKLMSEQIIKDIAAASAHNKTPMKYGILRYFNVAGASTDGAIGQNYPNATHLIKVAAQCVAKKRPKMAIFGTDYPTLDGTCVRDYIHVEDLAAAHLAVLEYLKEGKSEIFNVGYGRGFSVKEVIESAKRVSGSDFIVDLAPKRAGDPAILISDPAKILRLTSWHPRHADLDEIVLSAINWELKTD